MYLMYSILIETKYFFFQSFVFTKCQVVVTAIERFRKRMSGHKIRLSCHKLSRSHRFSNRMIFRWLNVCNGLNLRLTTQYKTRECYKVQYLQWRWEEVDNLCHFFIFSFFFAIYMYVYLKTVATTKIIFYN